MGLNPARLGHLSAVRPTSLLMLILACAPILTGYAAHTRASLVLSAKTARPGDTVTAGVVLEMDPRWHTYWKNSGASGMPTKIDWQVPVGIVPGETRWPLPQVLAESGLTTYIYEEKAVLIVPLKLPADLKPGTLQLKAQVSWLECDVQCVPGDATVQASLEIADRQSPSPSQALLKEWEGKLPKTGNPVAAQAMWQAAPKGDTRPLLLAWNSSQAANVPDFLPYASEDYEIDAGVQRLGADHGKVKIVKQVKQFSPLWPKQVAGVIVQETGGKLEGYEVTLHVGGGSAARTSLSTPEPGSEKGLTRILLYAFLGGLILNIMPCVLPVIALKIIGFVGQARSEPGEARLLGLIYALGVVLSFLALALLVIAAKAAGQKAGWGFQFGNPYFLVAMTTLLTLIALNLFGVFEVQPGSRTLNAASELSSGHGRAGAFFNGLLATVLATSCTAPFLGAAVGFAFTPQPAWRVLLVLATVGIGLALPYVVLTWQPGWLKFVPKPGPWMQRFKMAMGFPMLAAAVWLFSLAAAHYGERAWWLAIFLVLVGMAAWIYGEFVQRQQRARWAGWLATIVVLAAGYAFALESQLRWREPVTQAGSPAPPESSPGGIQWQPWSKAAVEQARSEGRPVLVDFTAKWCLTCNTIVKPALESAAVREKIRQLNAVAFIGDYTSFNSEITDELNRYARAGVPLVLVFPKNPEQKAIVLPEAITPGMVVRALDEAAGAVPHPG